MNRPDEWETDPGGYGYDDRDLGGPQPAVRERPRPRRWVIGLAMLTVFVLGVVGGVLADRHLAVGCAGCPPPAGVGVPLVGTLESTADGLIAVRTPDGRLVALRTSPATRVVGQEPRPGPVGALPRGTRVTVLGVPDTDGVLTVESVGVPG
ncbi:hypothetical protein [Actinomycetospora lemnae]|uniref:DUF5666 domain-containing protein n=1 Tax=Actinomycetospora lemnae TaxID=3019891 RepID=A0ABT5T277_9PSEU|nr:hypothetical protein [Actinomycetospora sp. DW7H6]MDD7968810.1 hypothetical protein [Actinomycetospora sp. DW7H6]